MPIYELTHEAITRVPTTTLAQQRFRERQDLQRLLRKEIHIVAPDTLGLAEEYSEWGDRRRSIDLLCLDKNASLVVVELKRTEDGGHMELQALRYAAMISKMKFSQAIEAHSRYLGRIGEDADSAEAAILRFLDWDAPQPEFARDVRIVLVSADFSKEITTSVIWLNERELDIRCVRMRPYDLEGRTLLDIEQILPVPEAEQYQVRLREKLAEVRESQEASSDWSRYDLWVGAGKYEGLFKRWLFLSVIKWLVRSGVPFREILDVFPARKFVGFDGHLSTDEFVDRLTNVKRDDGSSRDPRRYFVGADDLFFEGGKTWALSNQWSRYQLPLLDKLISEYPHAKVSYAKNTDEHDEPSNE